MHRRFTLSAIARYTGAVAAVTGLVLMSVPLAAHGAEPAPHAVVFIAEVNGASTSAPLSGIEVSVTSPFADAPVIATGTTGADGTVRLEIGGEDSQYVAHARWPGAIGDLESAQVSTEFAMGGDGPVRLTFWSSFGTVSGRVSAAAGGDAVTDLSDASLLITSGSAVVQRIVLAADGSFTSGALPTSAAPDYRAALAPPVGYALAAQQPAVAPFALPAGADSPTALDTDFTFALVTQTPTPAPTPTPTPTQEPTPTPEPTATPTPTPEPTATPTPTPEPTATPSPTPEPTATPAPAPTPTPTASQASAPRAPIIWFGRASISLGSAISQAGQADFASLVAQHSGAHYASPTVMAVPDGRVTGIAFSPPAPQAGSLLSTLPAAITGAAGLDVNGLAFAAMDLEALLAAAQANRTAGQDTQLADQLTSVQARNTTITRLDAAESAIQDYLASPTAAAFTAATTAARAAGIDHAFLNAAAETGADEATALLRIVRGQMDAAANTQQMDMLRLQSLSSKHNEATDLMSNMIRRLKESRSSIIGTMRSTPVALGTVQSDRGTVTGAFDLSAVPDGEHHLILDYVDVGVTLVAQVTVRRGELAATGGQPSPVLGIGIGLLTVGATAVIGASLLRRREEAA